MLACMLFASVFLEILFYALRVFLMDYSYTLHVPQRTFVFEMYNFFSKNSMFAKGRRGKRRESAQYQGKRYTRVVACGIANNCYRKA